MSYRFLLFVLLQVTIKRVTAVCDAIIKDQRFSAEQKKFLEEFLQSDLKGNEVDFKCSLPNIVM